MSSYIYSGQAVARDTRTCPRCGARMYVALNAVGTTHAIPDQVDTLAAREVAIQAAIADDAKRVMRLVRCPSCGQRETLPVALAYARVGIWFALFPVLPIIAPNPLEYLWIVPLGLAAAGLMQFLKERSRFRRAANAAVLPAAPPTRDPNRPKPAALPEARATKVPAAASPPPPPPPPIAPPRAAGPTSEPQFLRDHARGPDDPAS